MKKSHSNHFKRIQTLQAWIFPVAVFIALITFKSFWIFNTPGPIIFNDEIKYKEAAEAIFEIKEYAPISIKKTPNPYPPLYPILLSPAFLSEEYWYEIFIILNIFFSSSLVFAVYLITRSLMPLPYAYLAVILTALTPFQAIYQRFILSENLFLAVFLIAFYLAVIKMRKTTAHSFSLGVCLSLSYLTKHLALPALLILLAIWQLWPLIAEKIYKRPALYKSNSRHLAFFLLLGIAITYLPWIALAINSGYTLRGAMGLSVSGITKRDSLPPLSLLILWGSAYTSYFLLALGASLPLILSYSYQVIRKTNQINEKELRFWIAFGLLTITYLSVAIQHSWSARYNDAGPQYLLGRYLLLLTPLATTATCVTIFKIHFLKIAKKQTLILFLFLSLILIIGSRKILYEQLLWPFSHWFANLIFNSPDTMIFANSTPYHHTLIATFFLCAILFIGTKVNHPFFTKRSTQILLSTALITNAAFAFVTADHRTRSYGHESFHAKNLGRFFNTSDMSKKSIQVVIVESSSEITPFACTKNLHFFGVRSSECVPLEAEQDSSQNILKFYITQTRYPLLKPVLTYTIHNDYFYLYDTQTDWSVVRPIINNFGPKSTQANKGFNLQSTGESSIWVEADNIRPSTYLYFDNQELPTTRTKSIISAVVHPELFSTPGKYEIFLLDKTSNQASAPEIFEVK